MGQADALEIEITNADIDRGADFLGEWVGAERCSSDLIFREVAAELVARVCPRLESTALRSFLEHDRSFYLAPQL